MNEKVSSRDRDTTPDNVESTTRDDKVDEESKDYESMIPATVR